MRKYLLGFALVSFIGFTSGASAENFTRSKTKEYSSALAARARGGDLVEGLVEYKIYSLNSSNANFRPLKNCVLQHGYGITQPFIQQLRNAADFWGVDYLHEFAYVYFGQSLISKLLRDACESVIILLQESNATSMLEMTLRTERFLRDRACNLTAESLIHASGQT